MYAKLAIVLVFLSSCVATGGREISCIWRADESLVANAKLIPIDPHSADVEFLSKEYKRCPAYKNGGEIRLEKIMFTENKSTIYLFSISFVSDILVGFVVDSNSQIVDRIIISNWI